MDDGILAKYDLEVSAKYRYSRAEKYYSKDSPVTFKYLDYSYFNFTGLSLAYGITGKYTVGIETGYYFNKTQHYVFNNWQLQGNGFGDLTVENKYSFTKATTNKIGFTAGAGIRLPTGDYRQSINGVLLTRDVQSGTGALGFEPSFYLSKAFKDSSWNLMMNGKAEFNTTNPDNYRYGNDYDLSVSGVKQLSKWVSAIIQVRGELHEDDELTLFEQVQKSGGFKRVVLVPQIIFDLKKWDISLSDEIPIYQYFSRIQFANAYALSVGISRKFSLHK